MATNHEERAGKAWPVLANAARRRASLTYGELANAIGMHHRPLRYVLGLIQDYCMAEKLPPLTILVVQGGASGRPGSGFIAWDADSLDEGRKKVFDENWAPLPNPFAYALDGATQEDLTEQLLLNPSTAEDVYRKIKVRGIAQDIFRQLLLQAYDGACAFCGLSFFGIMDAAHIHPWAQCSRADRLNVRNGLLLCAVHHRMFDQQYFELTVDYVIKYSDPDLSQFAPYTQIDKAMSMALHQRKIRLPEDERWYPDPALIGKRHAWFAGSGESQPSR